MKRKLLYFITIFLIAFSVQTSPVSAKSMIQAMKDAESINIGSSFSDNTEYDVGDFGAWSYERFYKIKVTSKQKIKIVVDGSFDNYSICFWDTNYKYISGISIEGQDSWDNTISGLPCYAILGKGTYYLNVTCGSVYHSETFSLRINTYLTKASFQTVKNIKKSKIKAVVKPVFGAQGYQYQYATNKAFTKNLKTKVSTSTTNKIKLKKKKTYYVRVRAYVNNNGKMVYGKWSAIKKVKIKQ